LGAYIHLPDADSVHPQDVPISNGLPQLGIVSAEPSWKSWHPIAAAAHPHKIVRARKSETNREQDVVKDPHSA
jgi:hypothetical protein